MKNVVLVGGENIVQANEGNNNSTTIIKLKTSSFLI